jgi:hypothetical protein
LHGHVSHIKRLSLSLAETLKLLSAGNRNLFVGF